MIQARAIVNKLLEADDPDAPEHYVDWAKEKAELGDLMSIRFGYCIHLPDEDAIRENAQEQGIEVDWERLERDMAMLESNAMQMCRESGLYIQDEGHDSEGNRSGSAWIRADIPAEEQIALARKLVDVDEWPSTTNGTLWKFFPNQERRLYASLSEQGGQLLDVTVGFTPTDKLAAWLRLNLTEAVEDNPDDPEDFLRGYQPRLKGDLFIDRSLEEPKAEDIIYRNIDGAELLHYFSVHDMRALYKDVTARERLTRSQRMAYRYRVPPVWRSTITRQALTEMGVSPEHIKYLEGGDAPIWFYFPKPELLAYIRMVWGNRVKIREAVDDPDDPTPYLGRLKAQVMCSFCGGTATVDDKGETHPTDPIQFSRVFSEPRYSGDRSEWQMPEGNLEPIQYFKEKNIYFCRHCRKEFASDLLPVVESVDNPDDPDDPETFVKNFDPFTYVVNWQDDYDKYHHTVPLKSLERAREFAYQSSLYSKSKSVWIEKMERQLRVKSYSVNRDYEICYAFDPHTGERVDLDEALDDLDDPDEDIDPRAYLDATTGWIDTFLHAGLQPDLSQAHAGQFWRRYEVRGWHYMVIVGTRVPRWIIVQRVNPASGGTVFRRVFEFPDRAIKGMVTQFSALHRLLTKTLTRATDDWYTVDEEIEDMHEQHQRWRMRWLGGQIKEAKQSYRIKIGRSYWFEYRCWESDESADAQLWYHSHQRAKVLSMDAPGNGQDEEERSYAGHPATFIVQFADGSEFTATEDELLHSRAHFINQDPPAPPHLRESVDDPDDPEVYIHNMPVYTMDDIRDRMEEHGLTFNLYFGVSDFGFMPWGRWIVITGSAHWSVQKKGEYLPQSFFHEQLEKFCKQMGFTVYHIQLQGEAPYAVEFKLAIPKIQVAPESYQIKQKQLNDPDYREMAQVNDTIQREWLPEGAPDLPPEDDPEALVKAHVEQRQVSITLKALGFEPQEGERTAWMPSGEGLPEVWVKGYKSPAGVQHGVYVRFHSGQSHYLSCDVYDANQNEWRPGTKEPPPAFRLKSLGAYSPALHEIDQMMQEHAQRETTAQEEVDALQKIASKFSKWYWDAFNRMGQFRVNPVQEAQETDPDDPAINIERHTAALDLPALMQKLGFKAVHIRHSNDIYWEKVIGPRWWKVRQSENAATVDVRIGAAFGIPQGWVEIITFSCPVTELETKLIEAGLNQPQAGEVEESRKAATRSVQESEEAWSLPDGFKAVRYGDENSLELRTPENEPAGYVAWRSASDRVNIKYRTVEIQHLEVDPRFQNRGLGEALLRVLAELIPKLYPEARYVVAKTATSQGIIALLRTVFGQEIKATGTENLPSRSPKDWIRTQNRGYVKFKLSEAEDDDIDPEQYIKSLPVRVSATASNDRTWEEVKFNCADWFAQASLEEVIALAKEEWQSSYAADNVAHFFSDTTLKDFFANVDAGFEVYVNEEDAKRWVQHNQPDWFPYLWPNDVPIQEALDPNDPDDPSVNVERHMASMDIDQIMDRLGFDVQCPSWKCADPDYKWYINFHKGLKWSVLRASDEEPQMFNVSISKLRTVPGYGGRTYPEYHQVGGFKTHVGELEAKLRQALDQPPLQENLLQEMGGAVNIWLSPNGKPVLCSDHAEHAASEILKKPLKSWPGTYWEARGRIYQEMFRRGWMRIAIPHAQNKLMVDYRGKTTDAQWEWIYDKGAKDRLAITDDQENILVDYREGSQDMPPLGEAQEPDSDEIDPKAYAMSAFDIPAILQGMSYEKSTQAPEWFKVFRKAPTDLDIMIEVKRRGGGEANEDDAIYDITLYRYPVADNPKRQWMPIVYWYSVNNTRLVRLLKLLEIKIKANDLRGIRAFNFDIEEALPLPPEDEPEDYVKDYFNDLKTKDLNDFFAEHDLESNEKGDYGYGTMTLSRPGTLLFHHKPHNFNSIHLKIFTFYFRQWTSVSVYIHPRVKAFHRARKELSWRFPTVPLARQREIIGDMIGRIKGVCAANELTWPEMTQQFKAALAKFKPYATYKIKKQLPEALPLPPEDDPELLIPGYIERATTDNTYDPDDPSAPITIKPHVHGSAQRELEKLGFVYSTTALKHKIFGEPYVPGFWHKRYPKTAGRVLFINIFRIFVNIGIDDDPDEIYQKDNNTVGLTFRTYYIPSQGVQLMPRNMAQLIAIIQDLDAVMQRSATEHLAQEQEKQALEQVAQRHSQTVESLKPPPESASVPEPDPDDPSAVLKAHEQALLPAELKRLKFKPSSAPGSPEFKSETIYTTQLSHYWEKTYLAPNDKTHRMLLLLFGGHIPEVRAFTWNFDSQTWYQKGRELPASVPAKSEGHFCAVIRDLDAAMQRSAAASLSPEQEHEALQAVLQHHRWWWDQLQNRKIPGRMRPPEAA